MSPDADRSSHSISGKSSPQAPLELSIIIVNWRSTEFLRKCLATIYEQTKSVRFEIIVVDNASFDGSAEMIRREFPCVRFIQASENLGFAKANNLAFASAKGQNILFLNPDTEILDRAIDKLVNGMATTPAAGIMGAKLLNSDGSLQTSCVQSFPTILNRAVDAEYLRRVFPKSSFWGTRALYENRPSPVPVEIVSGACLLIRRAIFERIGQFSCDYFMYAEDVELCFKAKSALCGVFYLASAQIVHHGGQSSGKQEGPFAAIMNRKSLHTFMKVTRGQHYASAYRCATAAVAICRIILLGSVVAMTLGSFKRESLSGALEKWSAVLRWAIGWETVTGGVCALDD